MFANVDVLIMSRTQLLIPTDLEIICRILVHLLRPKLFFMKPNCVYWGSTFLICVNILLTSYSHVKWSEVSCITMCTCIRATVVVMPFSHTEDHTQAYFETFGFRKYTNSQQVAGNAYIWCVQQLSKDNW